MKNFWKDLKKPILCLAPMADVTDVAFRRIIAKYGKPDVMWTEFVSADGLVRAPEEGRKKLLKDLEYDESERPIVAQLFSSNPEYMEQASRMVAELGFDGIDINMGCPDRSIEKQGCGAAMIKNPAKAVEVIRAAHRGAPDLPISVKTRIGYNKNELDTWLTILLKENLSAITIHCRTRKEMSKVPARWEHIKEAVEIRNKLGVDTLIIGNGDVVDTDDARRKCEETGADGVMLGRAIFGNPFLFGSHPSCSAVLPSRGDNLTPNGGCIKKKLKVMLEHTYLFEELLGGTKNFALMKKHYKAYLSCEALAKQDDFEFCSKLKYVKQQCMEANNAKEVDEIVTEFLKIL